MVPLPWTPTWRATQSLGTRRIVSNCNGVLHPIIWWLSGGHCSTLIFWWNNMIIFKFLWTNMAQSHWIMGILSHDCILPFMSMICKYSPFWMNHSCMSWVYKYYICTVVYILDKYMALVWSVVSCTESHRKPQLASIWTVLSRMD